MLSVSAHSPFTCKFSNSKENLSYSTKYEYPTKKEARTACIDTVIKNLQVHPMYFALFVRSIKMIGLSPSAALEWCRKFQSGFEEYIDGTRAPLTLSNEEFKDETNAWAFTRNIGMGPQAFEDSSVTNLMNLFRGFSKNTDCVVEFQNFKTNAEVECQVYFGKQFLGRGFADTIKRARDKASQDVLYRLYLICFHAIMQIELQYRRSSKFDASSRQ